MKLLPLPAGLRQVVPIQAVLAVAAASANTRPAGAAGDRSIRVGATKDKAAWQGGFEQEKTQVQNQDSTPKSSATVVQREAILNLLRKGPRTTFELRALAGAMQAPTRVLELRRAGYEIYTEKVVAADESGLPHGNVARYHLVSEKGAQR